MTTRHLIFQKGHLFTESDGAQWLIDTGAPLSFGEDISPLGTSEVRCLPSEYMGLTAATLSGFVEVSCRGLLGADELGRFDHIFDLAAGEWMLSEGELTAPGSMLPIAEFMGIPIVTVRIAGSERRMFFDTGAQISYFQNDSLTQFPAAGMLADFYPGIGAFETATYFVPAEIGGIAFTLRCGSLPGLLGMSLMMAGVEGIFGNEIMSGRVLGYFPRRGVISL